MARHRNVNWNLAGENSDRLVDNVIVQLALLMDLRDELQAMRSDLAIVAGILRCVNFQRMPHQLRRLATALAPTERERRPGRRVPQRAARRR